MLSGRRKKERWIVRRNPGCGREHWKKDSVAREEWYRGIR
jgi:hypothetical protein